MKKLFLLCLLILISSNLFAQFTDDFSDGNFTANPVWTSDNAANWTIDANKLRSNSATASSTFQISTPSTKATQAQWEFSINLQFNTSSANFVDIYLTSANQNLNDAGNNGYFVRLGGTADEVSLYKITSGTAAILINGTDGILNTSNNTLKIKVIRNASNLWTLERDISGTGNSYASEGMVTDNSFNTSAYFGLRITQSTSSFFNKHFFDDFYVGDIIVDLIAPTVSEVKVINANQLDITFSENVIQTSAETESNYTVNNAIGNPSSAVRDASNLKLVHLTFANSFVSGTQNNITIQNVTDITGNPMTAAQNFNFTFVQTFEPLLNELLITEIMADPRGSAQPLNVLPDAEFVEIHNRSNKALRLSNTILQDGSADYLLPDEIILPNEYITLVASAQVSNFQGFGKVIGLVSFPSLTNGGERLSLINASGSIIFTVNYTDDWYQNSSKKDGGWTLEMIDTDNPCGEMDNWRASEADRGGTPAQINSIDASKPDNTSPLLNRVDVIDAQNIRLTFNEKMDKASLINGSYQISNGITVQSVATESPDFKRVTLTVSPNLLTQTAYTLTVSGVADCNGNVIATNTNKSFGLAEQGDSLDLILNEILFNPRTGGNDFVELYNQSDKFISLKDWKIANYDFEDQVIANQTTITTEDFVLAPKSYLVLTDNIANIILNYPNAKTENFLQMSSLPGYNDNEGVFFLINNQSRLMERFDYNEDFHFPILDDEDGVSLERITFDLPTNDKNSWQSASSTAGYATPGFANSQNLALNPSESEIIIENKVFTPDQSTDKTQTAIRYQFQQAGYQMNVIVYDTRGREIKRLAENLFLGYDKGVLTWDGTDTSGNLAKIGYYLILIRARDLNGNEKTYKETVVLGSRF